MSDQVGGQRAASRSVYANEIEVRRRVKEMRENELVDFVRDTIARLDALADRLEVFADRTSELDNQERGSRDA